MPLRERIEISPSSYRTITRVALAAMVLIVFTGAAVRLTGSGLGCPEWPKCDDSLIAPAETHALIEYSNRLLTGFVGIAAIAAALLGLFRKPYRRELELLAVLLPIGVLAQAGLGGLTVLTELNFYLVMAHYILSMVLIDAAFALAWCATWEPGQRPRARDRLGVWSVRALLPIGALTVAAGTAATAAGPHAGSSGTGEVVERLRLFGEDTLLRVVQAHGAIAVVFGLSVIAVIAILMREGGERRAIRPLAAVLGLLALQGVVGIAQWQLELPAGIVWAHIVLAVATWIAVLWSVGAAGLLEGEFERDASGKAKAATASS